MARSSLRLTLILAVITGALICGIASAYKAGYFQSKIAVIENSSVRSTDVNDLELTPSRVRRILVSEFEGWFDLEDRLISPSYIPADLILLTIENTGTAVYWDGTAYRWYAVPEPPNLSASSGPMENRSQSGIKLLPVDEAGKDPSFESFRNQLLDAVRNHDTNFLIGILDPKIENGYDIEEGTREFQKIWHPEDPQSQLWDVLSTILTGGGSFRERNGETEFCGPYVVSEWSKIVRQLPKGTDTLEYVAITGKDVVVRREAHLTAQIIGTLSYDVVKSIPNSQVFDRSMPQASSWVKIKTPTGQEGFVSDNYIQGPMDYGACFRRANGTWVITELAARE